MQQEPRELLMMSAAVGTVLALMMHLRQSVTFMLGLNPAPIR